MSLLVVQRHCCLQYWTHQSLCNLLKMQALQRADCICWKKKDFLLEVNISFHPIYSTSRWLYLASSWLSVVIFCNTIYHDASHVQNASNFTMIMVTFILKSTQQKQQNIFFSYILLLTLLKNNAFHGFVSTQ